MSRKRNTTYGSSRLGGYSYQRRNSPIKKVVLIVIAMICLIAVGMGIFCVFQKRQEQSPDKLLKKYFTYTKSENYKKMYEMLSTDSKSAIKKEDFINRNKNIYEGMEISNLKISIQNKEKRNDGSILVSYKESFGTVAGKVIFNNEAVFSKDKKQKSGFGITWKDMLILPDLTSTQKVKIQKDQASRGEILDRNDKVLAGKGTVSSIGIVPGKLGTGKDASIAQMAQLLGISADSINKDLSASWIKDDSFVPIKSLPKVDEQNLASVTPDADNVANQKLQQQLLAIPGVKISDAAARVYPYKQATAHLVGYVQNVTGEDLKKHPGEGYSSTSVIGKSGMESLYEKQLKGQDGYRITITDSNGKDVNTIAALAKQDGENIKLTIDVDLQSALYTTFLQDKSTHVAMNPYTGEVLALVNTPSFDPNNFVLGMTQTLWTTLNNDPNKPLYNRFRQTFAPGSSIKPIMSVIGLDNGVIDPNASDNTAEVKSWQKDVSWGSYHVTTLHDYSPINLQNALIYSDNIYFAKVALSMGKDKLQSGFDKMGFKQQIPFEITMAKSQYANKNGNISSEIQLADSGYGQGQVLMNPLHLAALYTMFSNSGNVIKPYLVYKDSPKSTTWLSNITTADHASTIEKDLEQVVNNAHGTGYGAHETSMTLAGKTGTAEIKLSQSDTNGTELGWFAVFTTDPNAAKPILLVSMTEDVKGRGGSAYVVSNDNTVLNTYFGNTQQTTGTSNITIPDGDD